MPPTNCPAIFHASCLERPRAAHPGCVEATTCAPPPGCSDEIKCLRPSRHARPLQKFGRPIYRRRPGPGSKRNPPQKTTISRWPRRRHLRPRLRAATDDMPKSAATPAYYCPSAIHRGALPSAFNTTRTRLKPRPAGAATRHFEVRRDGISQAAIREGPQAEFRSARINARALGAAGHK